MGIVNKLRLAGVTVIPERVKAKFAGNKKARFKGRISRLVAKLKNTKIMGVLSGKIKRIRKDREVSARRVTKAEKYATDVMLSSKNLSQDRIEDLCNQANLDLELSQIKTMMQQQEKLSEALKEMQEGVEKKIEQNIKREEQAIQASQDAIVKANEEGFKESFDSAMNGDCRNLAEFRAEGLLVNEFKKLIENNRGRIPSKEIILTYIKSILTEKESLFSDNSENMKGWQLEVVNSKTLVKKDQDRMNGLVANMKFELKLKSYLKELEQEGRDVSPEIFTFFSSYSDELGIVLSERQDSAVPDRYSFLRADSTGASDESRDRDESSAYRPSTSIGKVKKD